MDSKSITRYIVAIVVILYCVSPGVDAWSISCNGDTLASGEDSDFASFESQYNYCVAVGGSLGIHTDSDEEFAALQAKLKAMSRMSIDPADVLQNQICAGSSISCTFPRKRTAGASARGDGEVGPSIVVPETCSPSASECAIAAFEKLGVSAGDYVADLFYSDGTERGMTSRLSTSAPTAAPTSG